MNNSRRFTVYPLKRTRDYINWLLFIVIVFVQMHFSSTKI